MRHYIREKKTVEFIKSYLVLDNSFVYDIAVYGSDQIWRKQDLGFSKEYNPVYFADTTVTAGRKIAYAGSMGTIEVVSEDDRKFLKKAWDKFDAISVRESDLKQLIFEISGKDVPLVLDPVFLLTKTDWEMLMIKSGTRVNFREPFIVYYRLQKLQSVDLFVKSFAKKKGLKVFVFSGYTMPFKYSKEFKEVASAIDLITFINNAEFVVSSAFHGVAMSICLEKQFYAFSEKSQGNRLESLLSLFKLENRFNLSINDALTGDKINYSEKRDLINRYQDYSRGWLKANLKNENHS